MKKFYYPNKNKANKDKYFIIFDNLFLKSYYKNNSILTQFCLKTCLGCLYIHKHYYNVNSFNSFSNIFWGKYKNHKL